MTSGKRFEANVRESCKRQGIFYYRLKDSASSFNQGQGLRFSMSNMCDCFCHHNNTLLCLELKNHKGKSIPLGCIRDNQIKELTEASKYQGIKAGLLINFEDVEECYYLPIERFNEFGNERKSIPIGYCQEQGIKIEKAKKKTNSLYDIKRIFEGEKL